MPRGRARPLRPHEGLKMNWSSWSEFAAMGGYGVYVWGSFGVVAVTLAIEMMAVRARRRALRQLNNMPAQTAGFSETPHEA